ncbi:transcription antitermination factor NusB [Portibacter lacus]|uniref:N utilization substance protein B n=1 Tax=Portibacter lacus TaxID=1099794 RepID=A0AA37WDT6_9BACT|nr:transcription antitermination factor NusB [Portibacter lacus]GLR15480.1 N utilization substance protein B [Portibacter lacus]
MQLLYALSRDVALKIDQTTKRYFGSIDNTFNLYLLNLYTIHRICSIAIEDNEKRKSKHLPSAYDKGFSAKLFNNPIIRSIDSNFKLRKKFDKLHFENKADKDFCKKIYSEFSKTEEYKSYIQKESSDKDHLEILLELYRHCRKSEYFNEVMEDSYSEWVDDKSLIIGAIKKSIKKLPAEENFFQTFFPEDETIKEFGQELLELCYETDDELLEYIKPTLKNWDHERLAIIDMVLLKMAIVEFIHFKTIPTKVTLNEYVEIAKLYSTPKSKDFVNGILDKILKELQDTGKIIKEGRGLVE